MQKTVNTNTEKEELSEVLKEEQLKFQSVFRRIKHQLKKHSKSELVRIIFEQSIEYNRLHDVSKYLLEENKQLKGEKNETIKKA